MLVYETLVYHLNVTNTAQSQLQIERTDMSCLSLLCLYIFLIYKVYFVFVAAAVRLLHSALQHILTRFTESAYCLQ